MNRDGDGVFKSCRAHLPASFPGTLGASLPLPRVQLTLPCLEAGALELLGLFLPLSVFSPVNFSYLAFILDGSGPSPLLPPYVQSHAGMSALSKACYFKKLLSGPGTQARLQGLTYKLGV